jgi:predicted alpha/beta hydrolase
MSTMTTKPEKKPALGESIRFHASDGRALAGTYFAPTGTLERGLVLAGAMGVKQGFYAKFAHALSQRGIAVLIFDVRGIGASREGSVKREAASLSTWGELDYEAALQALQARVGDAPIAWLGHSVGGQLFGLLKAPKVDKLLLVASQFGYSGHWDGVGRVRMKALWRLIPIMVALTGRLPKQLLGGGEDIPPRAGVEWAAWGRHPEYILSYAKQHPERNFHTFKGKVRGVELTDDDYAPERAVNAIVNAYAQASREVLRVHPSDVGATQIGHFGAFTSRFENTLWKQFGDWLLEA